MSILGDKIKQANADRDRNSCEIKLGGDTITIYAKAITGMDVEAIQRRNKDFVNNPTLGAAVDMIIRKAELEDGSPAFDVADKATLLGQELDFIASIRSGLFPEGELGGDDSLEDDIKN